VNENEDPTREEGAEGADNPPLFTETH
jgi:phospholipid-transporting ATPase